MTLSLIDILVILVYFILILFIGFRFGKNRDNPASSGIEEFFLAGRRLTLPFFIATLVATWYGNILGVGEFVFTSGIAAWVCFGLPYYIAAILFAFFFAGRIRKSNVNTIPEQISAKYGAVPGLIASLVVLVITLPGVYILMLGVLIQLFTGWGIIISTIAGTVISIVIIFSGGFRADIYTNAAQFILMYLGFAILLIFSVLTFGVPINNSEMLPESYFKPFGDYSWQYVLSWYIIAFQTFVDPGFHQRCSAAKSPSVAKKGILFSVLFWAIFDFLTLTTGIYARIFSMPAKPMEAYPALAEIVLPSLWKGLFIVSLLATIMSSLNSYILISAGTIGHDLIRKFGINIFFRNISDKALIRIGLIVSGLMGIIIALAIPSAVQIIYKTASIAIPGLLVPLVVSFSKVWNYRKNSAVFAILAPVAISLLWFILREFLNENLFFISQIFFEIEPMIIGIICSLIIAIFTVRKRK